MYNIVQELYKYSWAHSLLHKQNMKETRTTREQIITSPLAERPLQELSSLCSHGNGKIGQETQTSGLEEKN